MSQPPPIPPDAVHYQLTRSQIVGQWFRLRMFQPKKAIIYGTLLVCGGALLALQGPGAFLGWVFLAFPFLFTFFLYRALNNLVTQHPEMLGPRSVSFDEDGVVFASATSRNEYTWTRIRKFTQNADYYFLHLDNLGTASTLPKSAFTPEQRDRFLSLTKTIAV